MMNEYSACWDKGDRTLLLWAVEFQDANMVEALLDGGMNPETPDQSPSDSFQLNSITASIGKQQ